MRIIFSSSTSARQDSKWVFQKENTKTKRKEEGRDGVWREFSDGPIYLDF
jgi:hypothetical protein